MYYAMYRNLPLANSIRRVSRPLPAEPGVLDSPIGSIEWLVGFDRSQFVGTESRLMSVFEILQRIARGTETDHQARITDLAQHKAFGDARWLNELDQRLAEYREQPGADVEARGAAP